MEGEHRARQVELKEEGWVVDTRRTPVRNHLLIQAEQGPKTKATLHLEQTLMSKQAETRFRRTLSSLLILLVRSESKLLHQERLVYPLHDFLETL